MATYVLLGGQGTLFVGEDKLFRLECLDAQGVPVDMTGWTVLFEVRDPLGTALLSLAATIAGMYSATRASNLQRADVAVTDTEMGQFVGGTIYRHSWKRLDAGYETVLATGHFAPEYATQV